MMFKLLRDIILDKLMSRSKIILFLMFFVMGNFTLRLLKNIGKNVFCVNAFCLC